MNFAETNPLANNAVQQYVPACPALQGRCCTPETMLVTIIDLVQLQQQQFAQFNQPQFAQPQFTQPQSIQHQLAQPQFTQPQFVEPQFTQPQFVEPQFAQPKFVESEPQFEQPLPQLPLSRSGGVRGSSFLSCVSVDQCSAGNIYGTNPNHFQEFGFISPEESDCEASEGEVLCVIQETVVDPGQELPCVQPSSCSEVYGEVSHIAEYGLQFSCDISTEVRCVSVTNPTNPSITNPLLTNPSITNPSVTNPSLSYPSTPNLSPTNPSQPPPPLPCVQSALCSEVYGTLASHFNLYGIQDTCPATDQVRCVVITTTQPSFIISSSTPIPPLTTASPVFAELPCVSPSLCHEEYGTQEYHLTTFGIQFSCSSGLVRCVSHEVGTLSTPSTYYHSTTTRGYSTTTRGYTSIHPFFTSQAPVTPPTAPVVNIIGPSPLYLGFGDNRGPSVHHSPESVNGQAGGDKQQQIRALLELLDKRLKQIVKRLPNQY